MQWHGGRKANPREIHPQNWRDQARNGLMHILSSAPQAPQSDAHRQGFQKVVLTALSALEKRVTKYVQVLTDKEHRGSADVLQGAEEIEQSLEFYFEERWRVVRGEPGMFDTKMWNPRNPDTASTMTPDPDYDDSSSDEEPDSHRRALAQCRESLLQSLDVSHSNLIASLLAADIISSRHADDISRLQRREQILAIIEVAFKMNFSQFQGSFLPMLRADPRNRALAAELEESLAGHEGSPLSTPEPRCRRCSLRDRISLPFLAPLLLERRLIPLDFYETLTRDSLTEEEAWAGLFSVVGHTQQILPILSEYYPGLVMEMEEYDISSLECRCLRPHASPLPAGDDHLEAASRDVIVGSEFPAQPGGGRRTAGRPTLIHVRQGHPTQGPAECKACSLRSRIDLDELADSLVSQGLIYQSLWREIKHRSLPESETWVKILQSSKEINWPSLLQGTYPAVAKEMAEHRMSSLKCECLYQSPSSIKTFRSLGRMSGSTTITESSKLSVPRYPLHSTSSGICWIVVNSESKHTYQKGGNWKKVCERSASIMHKSFQGLGFEMRRHDNLSAKELLEEASKLAKMDHSKYDCFACIVFSQYGDQDRLLCYDGNTARFSRLTQIFSASKCPSLAGKPKIFYRPGPRGASVQSGTLVSSRDGLECAPDQADFLLIHSCPSECSAGKDRRSSALLHVQKLAEVLEQHGNSKDFLTCLTMANAKISKSRSGRVVYMTAPFQSTLRKTLVFGRSY